METHARAAAVGEFLGRCMALLPAAIDAVMRGRPVDPAPWLNVAQSYELTRAHFSSEQSDAASLLRLGALAHLLADDKLGDELGSNIPSSATGSDPILALTEAVAAHRCSRIEGPDQAAALRRLGNALLQLLPHWQRAPESTQEGIRTVAAAFGAATEKFLVLGEARQAIQAAAGFVAMSNQLARNFAQTDAAVAALRVAEQVVDANSLIHKEDALALAALCHNAVGTATWLWQNKVQADALARGLALAERQKTALGAVPAEASPEVVLQLTEACLRQLLYLRMHLVAGPCDSPQRHLDLMRDHLEELRRLAETATDRDTKLLTRAVSAQIAGSSQAAGSADTAEQSITSLVETLSRFVEAARAVERELVRIEEPWKQREYLTERVAQWYAELAVCIEPVLDEIGLNHHLCRIVLALGAIGGGRLGAMCKGVVHDVLIAPALESERNEGVRGTIRQRQRVWAIGNWQAEAATLGRIMGITELRVALSSHADLSRLLQDLVRAENRKLLARIVAFPSVSRLSQHRGTRSADLSALLGLLPGAVWPAALGEYFGAAQEIGRDRACSETDLRLARPRGPRSGGLGDGLEANRKNEAASAPATAERTIPEWSLEIESVPEGATRDANGFAPGTVLKLDGRPTRITGIAGKGQSSTVYELMDIETGERRAMKVVRASDQDMLRQRLDLLVRDLERNGDEVIAVCDRLLQIDPTDETAAFNKGVLLLLRKEYEGALQCLERAAATAPRDVLNLVYQAAALAGLGRHRLALEAVMRSINVDRQETQHMFAELPWLAESIARAARLLDGDQDIPRGVQDLLSAVKAPAR